MEDTSLNWENLLTNTGVRYNTIYHSTIASTPFELLFDEKARLPLFPMKTSNKFTTVKPLLQNIFNLLQKLRLINWPLKTARNQNDILTRTLLHTNSKLVIKYSCLTIFILAKIPNKHLISKSLLKSSTLMTLT